MRKGFCPHCRTRQLIRVYRVREPAATATNVAWLRRRWCECVACRVRWRTREVFECVLDQKSDVQSTFPPPRAEN